MQSLVDETLRVQVDHRAHAHRPRSGGRWVVALDRVLARIDAVSRRRNGEREHGAALGAPVEEVAGSRDSPRAS